MGTFVTITVYHEDQELAQQAINEAYNEIIRIDSLLSSYKENSEVSFLNKDKYINSPSKDLLINLEKSNYYSEISQGSFDITVQPILDLYKTSFAENNKPPTEEEIKTTLELINYKDLTIGKSKIELKENMKVTLGGIAKGYVIDKAIETLQKNNIQHALVNAGGDMRAIGKKPTNNWQIALENPRDKSQYITILNINNKAVATSGDYERYFDPEKKFHHIINPNTGYSATELISVTIITDKAIDADALATSVFVLGKEEGLKLIETLDNVKGLLITKDRDIIKSSGFEN